MKKILVLVLAVLLLTGCNEKKKEEKPNDNQPKEYEYLFDFDNYKNIKLDDINKIVKIRYTVAGDAREDITDKSEISTLYNSLKNLKIGEETERACEDNTTVYKFIMNDGNSYSIEIECDWFVIGKKHYNIVK